MTISRLLFAIAISIAASAAGPSLGRAQDLSEASLTMSSGWSGGYMGLGGNLGQAIVRHHRQAKHDRPVKTARTAQPRHHEARVRLASFTRHADTPTFLIARTLDQTGLNIGMLRTRP